MIFAAGADIKNKFLFAKDKKLYFGPDIGDISDAANYERFKKEAASLAKKIKARPDIIACDLHPGYFTTNFAKNNQTWFSRDYKLVQVQHHHAHIASVMHEYGLKQAVIGVSFDGTGYGTDGNIWGGEFFVARKESFERAAHLKYRKLPGGDKVIFEPWRMVLSILGEKGSALIRKVGKRDKDLVLLMMVKNINSPLSSSAGRLFDAAAALLGECIYAKYEAEGPMKLESICDKEIDDSYEFEIFRRDTCDVIDTKPLFLGMIKDMKKGISNSIISARFHNSMSGIIVETVKRLSKRFGIKDIALSGGVFQNNFLTARVIKNLKRKGFNTFINGLNPVNDLNIAVGQYHMVNSE